MGAVYDGTNNVAGLYQTLGSTPGSTYQASGWFYINSGDELGADCYVWIQVEFYDSSTNLLALYKSGNFNINAGLNTWVQFQVTNACDVTQPVSTGDPFFNTYAITGAVSQLTAPAELPRSFIAIAISSIRAREGRRISMTPTWNS